MSTALDRARKAQVTPEHASVRNLGERLDLAMAYLGGEITMAQAARGMADTRWNATVRLGVALLAAAKQGAGGSAEEGMNSWHSYPSIYAVGHRAVADLMNGPVNVEEKVDGSQFSFGITETGELMFRSKGAILLADAPEKMFTRAVESIKERASALTPGWTYRGEYLRSPKHNSLAYRRVPDGNVVVFDINTGHEQYMPYEAKWVEAQRIGLECVDLIYSGVIGSATQFAEFLERDSALGGVRIEGVVVKPRDYNLFGLDKKVLMAKFVSEHFKEVHAKEWKKTNPTHGDVLVTIGQQYATEARWRKAIEHLRDAGQLEGSPRDIGALVKEVPADVRKECEQEIKDQLFKWAWPSIQRMVIRGLPEWYKGTLMAGQFEASE